MKKKILVALIFVIVISGLCIYHIKQAKWQISDAYGEWKVVRLVGAYDGTKGDLPYGSNIGRSFCITEEKIIDSTDLQEAILEDEEQRCFSMDILQREETVFDVVKSEDIAQFQIQEGIIVDNVGLKGDVISKYTFSAKENNDYHIGTEFSVFTYNDKNKMLVDLPMGYYLLERFKEQQKVKEPYGRWMVNYRISKGNSKENGIKFMDYYGQCFDITKDLFGRCNTSLSQVKWEVKEVNRIDFEKQNGIQEGLGLNNEKIQVWFGTGKNNFSVQMIPINDSEMMILIDEQWFMLKKVEEYQKPKEKTEDILTGNWKFVQFLAAGEVDEDKEWELGRSDYIAGWYTTIESFDPIWYAENAVSDWNIAEYSVLELCDKYEIPANVACIFNSNECLQVATRKVYEMEQIFIILDKDTIIRGRNGLWYILEKM